MRLLVVDDEEANNNAVRRALRRLGEFEVTVSTLPLEALELVATKRFDMLMIDYSMAELNGVEFLERAQAHLTKTVVVMNTALPELTVVCDARARGLIDVLLAKPWSFEDLESTLNLARSMFTLRSMRETLTPLRSR